MPTLSTVTPGPHSSTIGLTSTAAAARLAVDGANKLPPPVERSALRRLVAQFVHFFALMLWVAAALAFVAGIPELGAAIALVIVLNALFAFFQESRAGQAAARLRALLPMQVTVVRDGRRQQVDSTQVVVGDVLALEGGDRIPADGTVLVAHGLLVDTALLTGESEPERMAEGDDISAGTFVVEGEALALVSATGGGTRLADIAAMTTATDSPASPLTIALHRVVRTVALIAVSVGASFFIIMLAVDRPASDGLVLAIGVTVALVPEALLPTVTLSLAWGAEQMAHRRVLVRNLEAVETLGSTTFICTDKTGTLTHNQMTVVDVWTPTATATIEEPGYSPDSPVLVAGDRSALEALARAAVRCSTGYVHRVQGAWQPHGDPMEVAIDVFAHRLGLDTEGDRALDVARARFPFDPRRRRMSVVVGDELLVKGAPDAVLPRCDDTEGAAIALDRMMAAGLRVLAVSRRPVGPAVPVSADEAETGLELLGLVAMEDPPRLEVRDALAACRRAGVRIAMVTGDHPGPARTIADQVGLRRPDDPVVVGHALPEDDDALGALIDHDGCVVARATPEDKVRIARALRARGHVVAMTGDGVNDGPSLHEAADLVLLDDAFASIVAGVEQGRATYGNMRRFLAYHLTDNVAELTPFLVWALSGGNFPLALGVMQILALDLGTDTLSAVALGAEPPGKHLLDGPPVKGRLMNHSVVRRSFGLFGPLVAALTMAAFLVSLFVSGWRPGEVFPTGPAL
ncbi:MAG TPA: cation-transporting P-type ATPase, partial [Acidimicrobiales bacterium]|nr:cation-transporting P-type ATPase [Acidimicrobiales bacterium]